MRDIDDLTPDEALAEQLADKALAKLAIPADLVPMVRVTLIGNLLQTPQGRAMLRRAKGDPVVTESGDAAKPGAEVASVALASGAKKRGAHRGKP